MYNLILLIISVFVFIPLLQLISKNIAKVELSSKESFNLILSDIGIFILAGLVAGGLGTLIARLTKLLNFEAGFAVGLIVILSLCVVAYLFVLRYLFGTKIKNEINEPVGLAMGLRIALFFLGSKILFYLTVWLLWG